MLIGQWDLKLFFNCKIFICVWIFTAFSGIFVLPRWFWKNKLFVGDNLMEKSEFGGEFLIP